MNKDALINFILSHLAAQRQTVIDIAEHFEEMLIPKNNFFLKEGTSSRYYMYLEEGFMRAYTLDLNGDEVTTGFYLKNQIVLEVSSFFTHGTSKENIQAITDCKGFAITFQQLNMLFHTIPEFREFGRAILVKGFVALKQRTLSLINETAEERYINFVNTNPAIFRYAPLKHIASYLGITDTSLSRIRREYAKK